MVFPALLFLYIWLFETDDQKTGRLGARDALLRSTPALAVTAVLAYWKLVMTPREFHGAAVSAYAYRITQPLVAFRYFWTFFFPGGLTADTDLTPIDSIWKDGGWAGFLFLGGLLSIAVVSSKKRTWRPVTFGIGWFLLALLPTSLYPLAEVENDHRMFFPFVGLVLGATWPAALWVYGRTARRRVLSWGLPLVCGLELGVLSLGTIQRNITWRTEESLWRDVSITSPRNARGLMNYAVSLLQKGEPEKAIDLHRNFR